MEQRLRRSQFTRGEWAPHTPHSIKHLLNETQKPGKVARSGPHLLRHSGLTRLANLGASVYAVDGPTAATPSLASRRVHHAGEGDGLEGAGGVRVKPRRKTGGVSGRRPRGSSEAA